MIVLFNENEMKMGIKSCVLAFLYQLLIIACMRGGTPCAGQIDGLARDSVVVGDEFERRASSSWRSLADRWNPDVLDQFIETFPGTDAQEVAFGFRVLQIQQFAEIGKLECIDDFLVKYVGRSPLATKTAVALRYEATVRVAERLTSPEATSDELRVAIAMYADFIKKYPSTVETVVAYEKVVWLSYRVVELDDTYDSCRVFLRAFPDAPQLDAVVDLAAERRLDEVRTALEIAAVVTNRDDFQSAKNDILKQFYSDWQKANRAVLQAVVENVASKQAGQPTNVVAEQLRDYALSITSADTDEIESLFTDRIYSLVIESDGRFRENNPFTAGTGLELQIRFNDARKEELNASLLALVFGVLSEKTDLRHTELLDTLTREFAYTRQQIAIEAERNRLTITTGLNELATAMEGVVAELRGMRMQLASIDGRLRGIDKRLFQIRVSIGQMHMGLASKLNKLSTKLDLAREALSNSSRQPSGGALFSGGPSIPNGPSLPGGAGRSFPSPSLAGDLTRIVSFGADLRATGLSPNQVPSLPNPPSLEANGATVNRNVSQWISRYSMGSLDHSYHAPVVIDWVDAWKTNGKYLAHAYHVTRDDLGHATKVNGKYASRDFKGFLRYADGIWKSVYDERVVLSADQPTWEREFPRKQDIRVEYRHLDGDDVNLRVSKLPDEDGVAATLDHNHPTFRKNHLDRPSLKLELVDQESGRAVVHVRCAEYRSLWADLGGAGSDLGPLDSVVSMDLRGESFEETRAMRWLIEEAARNHSEGWYFKLLPESNPSGGWYGPFGSMEDAKRAYESTGDKGDETLSLTDEDFKYFDRSPAFEERDR